MLLPPVDSELPSVEPSSDVVSAPVVVPGVLVVVGVLVVEDAVVDAVPDPLGAVVEGVGVVVVPAVPADVDPPTVDADVPP